MGLVGEGTSYTLSPAIHNHAIKLLYKDYVYVNFDIAEPALKSALEFLWDSKAGGLNVTKPFKTKVAKLIVGCQLGSVNTLVRGEKGWVGHSTDGAGFARSLHRIHCDLDEFTKVIVIGNGGAAHSLIHYLSTRTPVSTASVSVIRRSPHKDAAIIADSGSLEIDFHDWSQNNWDELISANASNSCLIIQATSPASEDIFSGWKLGRHDFKGAFVDLIYDRPSPLYFEAMNLELKCQDGLGMLIEQARLSQELWWGKSAPYEELVKAIKHTGRLS